MSLDDVAPILIAGQWRPPTAVDVFVAENPATGQMLPARYARSAWSDAEAALDAAAAASVVLQALPTDRLAAFLRDYADRLESRADDICRMAAEETGLAVAPRLRDIELPRTTNQLRQAAAAATDNTWRLPVIDAKAGLASMLEPLGPVVVMGPNNFPLAYNSISGGDFAAAIAAGNPVIAIAHPNHPSTCRLLAECAHAAAVAAAMPVGTVQLLYGLSRDDGLRLVADARVGAAAFTGSRRAGLALKAAADAVGKPIYLEMSSVNPLVILPGALAERAEDVLTELIASALMAAGQFCTSPGLVFLTEGPATDAFLAEWAKRYREASCGTLFGRTTRDGLAAGIQALVDAGAQVLCGNRSADRAGYAWANTLLRVSGDQFLHSPEALQAEVFGNACLAVVVSGLDQLEQAVGLLEGNLTGCIYSARDGRDDAAYDQIARKLRPRVGRLLNDKMPTGVAVSPAMNHGGPFPATGHPHFTAVGLPAALRRFTRLACYDHVRPHRLPAALRNLHAATTPDP